MFGRDRSLRDQRVTATVTRVAPHDLRLFRLKRVPDRVIQRFPSAPLPISYRRSVSRADPVLGAQLEIAGIMPLVQLHCWIAEGAIDHPTTLNRVAGIDLLRPALEVLVAI